MKNKNWLSELLFTLFIIGGTLAVIFVIFNFTGNASEDSQVMPYENIQDYSVYDGRNVNEYWKTTLTDNQKVLYEELKEAYLQFKPSFSTKVKKISSGDFNESFIAVVLDHPEIFWIDSYTTVASLNSNVNTRSKIYLQYAYNEDESKAIKERIEPKIQVITDEAKSQENDYQKIRYVHDKLINSAVYTDYTEENRNSYQSIVSIFDENKTVCAGYTYAFKVIMDRLGIESIATRDVSNELKDENHIWNMVKLYGKWYNIDITWDDDKKNGGTVKYNYFLKSNEEFYKTHEMQYKMPQNENE